MTEVQLWTTITTFVQAGGAMAILVAIVLAFFTGKIVTGAAYRSLVEDRDEWRTAYRAVADVALRQVLDRRT